MVYRLIIANIIIRLGCTLAHTVIFDTFGMIMIMMLMITAMMITAMMITAMMLTAMMMMAMMASLRLALPLTWDNPQKEDFVWGASFYKIQRLVLILLLLLIIIIIIIIMCGEHVFMKYV